MGFIAGKYDVVTGDGYAAGPTVGNATSIGQTEGVSLEFTSIEENIVGDSLGRSVQDGVYRGANCYLDLNMLQADRSNYIAGRHVVTFGEDGSEADLGETDGVDLEWTMHAEMFSGDNLGGSLQDGIYQGADVFVQATLLKFNQQSLDSFKAYWPWGKDHGTPANQIQQLGKLHKAGAGEGTMGRLASNADVMRSLILTATAGTPAASNVLDFHQVKLAAGFPIRMLMAPSLRRTPVRFQVYPDSTKWFTFTAGGGPTLADLAWPWNATWGNIGTRGVLLSTLATPIQLTALTGTPAGVGVAPLKIIAKSAVLAPGFPIRLSLTPTLRRLRIRLQLLPYPTADDSDQVCHFETLTA